MRKYADIKIDDIGKKYLQKLTSEINHFNATYEGVHKYSLDLVELYMQYLIYIAEHSDYFSLLLIEQLFGVMPIPTMYELLKSIYIDIQKEIKYL